MSLAGNSATSATRCQPVFTACKIEIAYPRSLMVATSCVCFFRALRNSGTLCWSYPSSLSHRSSTLSTLPQVVAKLLQHSTAVNPSMPLNIVKSSHRPPICAFHFVVIQNTSVDMMCRLFNSHHKSSKCKP